MTTKGITNWRMNTMVPEYQRVYFQESPSTPSISCLPLTIGRPAGLVVTPVLATELPAEAHVVHQYLLEEHRCRDGYRYGTVQGYHLQGMPLLYRPACGVDDEDEAVDGYGREGEGGEAEGGALDDGDQLAESCAEEPDLRKPVMGVILPLITKTTMSEQERERR